MSNWPPYDPITDTRGGWYEYGLMKYELEVDEQDRRATLLPKPRVAWRADHEFLNDLSHRLEGQWLPGEPARTAIEVQIVRHMLDCMRRDHKPWDGPPIPWHKTGATQ